MSKPRNLIGQVFGRLIVAVCSVHLRSGNTQSCGCLHRKIMKAQKGSKNSQWRGGRIKDSRGYMLIHQPNHPYAETGGYVFEHRLIAEQYLV